MGVEGGSRIAVHRESLEVESDLSPSTFPSFHGDEQGPSLSGPWGAPQISRSLSVRGRGKTRSRPPCVCSVDSPSSSGSPVNPYQTSDRTTQGVGGGTDLDRDGVVGG